jgi:hypothetical protein
MESASLKLPSIPRNGNAKAYLAGGGATAALVAAAIIVFLGVAAFVGFNGLPFGADDSADATVDLSAGVPEAAAAASSSTAGAVADDPASPSDAALAEIADSLPPGATSDIPGVNELLPGGTDPGTGPTIPTDPGSPGLPGVPGVPSIPGGGVGDTIDDVEDAASGLGLPDLGLGDATDPVTGPVDDAVNDVVNGVGGALGNPNLGNQVGGAVNQVTDGLLGGG